MTRKRKREIERVLDDLDDGDGGELPEASDLRIVNAVMNDEFEFVDGEPDLVRCYGDVYRTTPSTWEKLREMTGEGE